MRAIRRCWRFRCWPKSSPITRRCIADPAPTPLVAVLAAGRGSRFGGGKLDATLSGRPVGAHVLRAVASAGLPPGFVVTGPDSPEFLDSATGWGRVINPCPDSGIGSSLCIAAQTAQARGADAMLVLLADMPLIDPRFLSELIGGGSVAATCYPSGKPGVPALFPAVQFDQLNKMTGDSGAAAILRDIAGLRLCEPPERMLLDIDRPEDLARAAAWLKEQDKGDEPG